VPRTVAEGRTNWVLHIRAFPFALGEDVSRQNPAATVLASCGSRAGMPAGRTAGPWLRRIVTCDGGGGPPAFEPGSAFMIDGAKSWEKSVFLAYVRRYPCLRCDRRRTAGEAR
jgi:hypothetical protein